MVFLSQHTMSFVKKRSDVYDIAFFRYGASAVVDLENEVLIWENEVTTSQFSTTRRVCFHVEANLMCIKSRVFCRRNLKRRHIELDEIVLLVIQSVLCVKVTRESLAVSTTPDLD